MRERIVLVALALWSVYATLELFGSPLSFTCLQLSFSPNADAEDNHPPLPAAIISPCPHHNEPHSGNLFVEADFARRILLQVCPEAAYLVSNQSSNSTASAGMMSQVEAMVHISELCPYTALPYPGRHLWGHFGDAHFLDPHTPNPPNVTAMCLARRDHSRACILMAQNYALGRTVPAVKEYLHTFPEERIVVVGFSSGDLCVPHGFYKVDAVQGVDTVATADEFMAVLDNPRLLRWFTENPCITHRKLTPLPIGPKFQWLTGSEPLAVVKARLAGALSRAAHSNRAARKRRLVVAVTVENTNNPHYVTHKGIRADYLEHMKAVAEDGGPPSAWGTPEEFMEGMQHYRFVWAPPGMGIDTHRAWEAMLAGCIPISIRSPVSPAYDGMPMVVVDDFDAVNVDRLEQEWASADHDLAHWITPKLFAFHWLHVIEQAARG